MVSSPVASGGGGSIFEQHVGAYWLVQLLVRAIPPILIDCQVVEVSMQSGHLGWETDDFLIVCEDATGLKRKLACQVKRSFTVSKSDEECRKAIGGFWKDFQSDRFSKESDRLALVTLRGSNVLLEHLTGLFNLARTSRDGTEFEAKLGLEGFISSKTRHYCDDIRSIVADLEGAPVSEAQVWPFLRTLDLLSLDLASSTAQTQAQLRSLLAITEIQSRSPALADATWKDLLALVGDGSPNARSFGRDDLPQALRDRHSETGSAERDALRALSDHSLLVLRLINSSLGGRLHLERSEVVQKVLEALETSQIVLVAGPAGSGKSAIAKSVLERFSADGFAFCFRAEEFAEAHLDTTLVLAQVPVNGAKIEAILAAQSKKLVLVESVERLLESSKRDAFSDLMSLVSGDGSLKVLLTCRDYSSDLVRAAFLSRHPIGSEAIAVPPLKNVELAQAEAAFPQLSVPLASLRLRELLRNPFLLEKALLVDWSGGQTLPESERELRLLFWKQVVRAEGREVSAQRQKRERAFEEIALRRARNLTPYVDIEDLDADAIEGLNRDSLLLFSKPDERRASPAHDVLEDWAILQWIDKNYSRNQSFVELANLIGPHPAVRRAYRAWVAELVEMHDGAADTLMSAAYLHDSLPKEFRDDSLIALFRAPSSRDVIQRTAPRVWASDAARFKRAIHLLRVGCTEASLVLHPSASGSLSSVPAGPAWEAMMELANTQFEMFESSDRLLLLGLVEDWSKGVDPATPYPGGSAAASALAHKLLNGFSGARADKARERVLQVIAKVPAVDAERFESLLRGTGSRGYPDPIARDLRKIVLGGVQGLPMVRDLPELAIAIARDHLYEDENNDRQFYGSSIGTELEFGIDDSRSTDSYPASAFHGPWLSFLRYHPRRAMDFICEVFDRSADWYRNPRGENRLEPAWEAEVRFKGDKARTIVVNERFWFLYRGLSVGPYALQSILMALERWLFELADSNPTLLDQILLSLLNRSGSGAVVAVVASLATAFPRLAGETLLVLLRTPALFRLDKYRLAHESGSARQIASMFPSFTAEGRVFEAERAESDSRPHRKRDLELAILDLQFGPLGPRVQETLDGLRAEMRPANEQTEADKLWRLSMHRMDRRHYLATAEAGSVDLLGADAPPPPQARIRLELSAPEPDVQALVSESAPTFARRTADLGLLMWGLKTFQHEDSGQLGPESWRTRLEEAQAAVAEGANPEEVIFAGGPSIVAAVCVRDHWQEMNSDERDWCTSQICSEVLRTSENWDEMSRVQRNPMSADRSCSWALTLLIDKPLSEELRALANRAQAAALMNPNDEVRWYFCNGVAANCAIAAPDFALRCVNAIAEEATLVDKATVDRVRASGDEGEVVGESRISIAGKVRERFSRDVISGSAFESLDTSSWFGAEAEMKVLRILGAAPTSPLAIETSARAAQDLADWWAEDDGPRRRRTSREDRPSEAAFTVEKDLAEVVLRTTPEGVERILRPILAKVEAAPRGIDRFVLELILAEDRLRNPGQFWTVWSRFADQILAASWIHQSESYENGRDLLSAIFLGTSWKEGVRHWTSLEGYDGRIHEFFARLPPRGRALRNYLRFLFDVGERSFPGAFVNISACLGAGDTSSLLSDSEVVFMLEVLLQRQVYGRPVELKRDGSIRGSVLFLLDTLVEVGSSAAFRMRDDFVTPISLETLAD